MHIHRRGIEITIASPQASTQLLTQKLEDGLTGYNFAETPAHGNVSFWSSCLGMGQLFGLPKRPPWQPPLGYPAAQKKSRGICLHFLINLIKLQQKNLCSKFIQVPSVDFTHQKGIGVHPVKIRELTTNVYQCRWLTQTAPWDLFAQELGPQCASLKDSSAKYPRKKCQNRLVGVAKESLHNHQLYFHWSWRTSCISGSMAAWSKGLIVGFQFVAPYQHREIL